MENTHGGHMNPDKDCAHCGFGFAVDDCIIEDCECGCHLTKEELYDIKCDEAYADVRDK